EAVEGLHKDYRQTALQSFKAEPVATQKPAEKEAHVLYTLSKLAGKEYYPAAAQAFERFFSTYPNYTGNNEIELWYGDLHRVNGNYLAAITQYKKADKLYPQSPYKAASLRLIGDIYADNLKNTEAATQAYTTVLRLYPDSSETGIVYKHMAILDENNKQYDSALINYDKAIELLGTTPAAYEAYRGKADVYVKTKNYTEAYQTLHKAATVFQTNPGQAAQALEEAAQIARKKLQDEVKYTQSLEKAIALAPHATQTAENMYVLAHAYEKQGKTAQAQEMYKRLILNFPTHKQAAKAQNRLTGLSK
ncbi:MAG: tetratricopeptide repeat protein, partial [Elusimicrobiaceae bacterium]|nr:tetratricopeptide repeat protein [Elusimicrobiaceae bacterium]